MTEIGGGSDVPQCFSIPSGRAEHYALGRRLLSVPSAGAVRGARVFLDLVFAVSSTAVPAFETGADFLGRLRVTGSAAADLTFPGTFALFGLLARSFRLGWSAACSALISFSAWFQ
jgi:hypothetical protein